MARRYSRYILSTGAVALLLSPPMATAASAQPGGYQGNDAPPVAPDRNAPPPDYGNAPPSGYSSPPPSGYSSPPPSGYADNRSQPYPDLPPPPNYDGTRPPPPPPGYQPSTADAAAQRERDDRYAADAERWARDNCVKSQSNAGTGALLGGILGAIIGNGLSGRRDRGAGTLAGAAIGAVGGAAIASSSGDETSPGCPPGYVVRREARPYAYDRTYYYAAPGWYRPWVFVGGYWNYRPYPYHDYYYRTYRPYRGDWRRDGDRGRPGRGDGYRDRDGRGR